MSYGGPFTLLDIQTNTNARVLTTKTIAVDEAVRLIGASFTNTAVTTPSTNDNFWSVSRGTAATVAITAGVATLTSGTTNLDWCALSSTKPGRFMPVATNLFRAQVRFPSVTATSTTAYIGAFAHTLGVPVNGYAFAVSATGAISVQSYSNTAAVLNANSGFNGNLGTTYTVPDVNYHIYEIMYLLANVLFFVDGVLLHSVTPTTALFSSTTMTNPAAITVVNAATTSRVVNVGFASIIRFGKEKSLPVSTYIPLGAPTTTVCKVGPGTLHRIIVGKTINAATISIYDAVTATNTLAVLTSGASALAPYCVELQIDFFTGLTIVTSAAQDVTAVYD